MINAKNLWTDQLDLHDLLPALHWLDQLLKQAVDTAQSVYGNDSADPYRSLYISLEEVDRMFSRQPGTRTLVMEEPLLGSAFTASVKSISRLSWLAHTYQLSDFDLAVMLIVLAPEIDLRYERLYGYLQDDVTRKRASVDLVLNLLCSSGELKLNQHSRFDANAPLIHHQILHLIADPHYLHPSGLGYFLKLDEQILHWLLGHNGLDSRLAGFCQRVEPSGDWQTVLLRPETLQALRSLVHHSQTTAQPLCFYFHGGPGAGKRRAAEAIAHELGKSLFVANLSSIGQTPSPPEIPWLILFREVQLQNGLLYLHGLDAMPLNNGANPGNQSILQALAESSSISILAGSQPWLPNALSASVSMITVHFPIPEFDQRRAYWQSSLSQRQINLSQTDLDMLADRFRLTSAQIDRAVTTAQNQMRWQIAQKIFESSDAAAADFDRPQPTRQDLFAAARQQTGDELKTLARQIRPLYRWEDIVLPSEPLAQLQELCNQVKHRHLVYQTWGFERKLSLGKGLNVLFSGSPGTGKTMAAEVIANELQLDLYRIDLSQIVSKYIGETEKNLDRIFTAAESSNAILLFDEADALFGKRSEVKDAHDRYANLEVAYLLQKMEAYDGITILTTNLRQNLDEAFNRRIRFMIEFPFPEAEDRYQIWQNSLPKELPLASDVNLDRLAQQFRLTGGNIRNIALAAAFLAAEAEQVVTIAHLLQATKRELQKMGRLVSDSEFLLILEAV